MGAFSDSTDIGGLAGFAQAATDVVRHVRASSGFPVCMVGQVSGDRWLVIAAEDPAGELAVGNRVRWADSISSRVLTGSGPVVLSDPAADPRVADAPVLERAQIGTYVGVPLNLPDGRLFAVLCAVHPDPSAAATVDADLFVLCARLLEQMAHLESAWLLQERRAAAAERALAGEAAGPDPVAKLPRWSRSLTNEDQRCARYGHGASVITVRRRPGSSDDAAAGPDVAEVAERIRRMLRLTDVVATVGPREVAVLLAETSPDGARQAAARICAGLGADARHLAFGLAHRERTGLVGAWSVSRLAAADGAAGQVRELGGPVDDPVGDPWPVPPGSGTDPAARPPARVVVPC